MRYPFSIGVCPHGYGQYDIIRDDPSFSFGKQIEEIKAAAKRNVLLLTAY